MMEQLARPEVVKLKNGKVVGINFDQIQNQYLVDKMSAALYSLASIAVQRNDIGNLSPWMTTRLGRLVMQFRSFAFVALRKQLGYNLHRFDLAHSVPYFLLTTLFGGLTYMTWVQLTAPASGPERQAYIKKHLTEELIAKQAFMRAGWSSIVPPFTDVAIQGFFSGESFFNPYATEGTLRSEDLIQTPVLDTIDTGLRGIGGATKGLMEVLGVGSDKWTQEDGKALYKMLPLQNFFGMSTAMNALNKATGAPLEE